MFAYFDESGKFTDSDFVCMAGYLSDESRWLGFCQAWGALLVKHEIPFIHMKQLMSLQKPYDLLGWTKEHRNSVLAEFIEVIHTYVLAGFGVAVDSKYLRSMSKEDQGIIGDPQMLCFQRLMKLLIRRLSSGGYDLPVMPSFDDSEEYSVRCYRMWSQLRKRDPEFRARIASVSFADDMVFVPLQGADVLAHQTNFYLRRKARGQTSQPEMEALMKSYKEGFGIDFRSELWDEEALQEYVQKEREKRKA